MMRQYFLVVNQAPDRLASVMLASDYVQEVVTRDPWVGEPIRRIVGILATMTINEHGLIRELSYDKQGNAYFSDKYYYAPEGKLMWYKIIKQLRRYDHVYELRFMAGGAGQVDQCRIIITLNREGPFFLWTYGFTKKRNTKRYFNYGDANQVTDLLAQTAELIYNHMDMAGDHRNGKSVDWYIGMEGERNELRPK